MPDGLGRRERGIALIMVLIVLALLLTVVGEFAVAMRLEGRTTLNFRADLTASYLAEAAYHRAVAELLPDTTGAGQTGAGAGPGAGAIAVRFDERGLLVVQRSPSDSPKAPEREGLALGPGRLSYRITDEQARINVNQANNAGMREILARLLSGLGVELADRDVIVDSIQDWLDANEDHRLNGAESDHYLALPVPYRSKNATLDAVDELLQVRGVTPELFYGRPESPGLVDYLTVQGSGRINVNTASARVLRALGQSEADVEACVKGRQQQFLSTVLPQCGQPARTTTTTQHFRIEATGEVPGQGRRTLTAVVERTKKDGVTLVTPRTWRWTDAESRR